MRGCAGKRTRSPIRPRPSTIRASRSGWTFAARWIVAATYLPGSTPCSARIRRALAGDRRELEARVRHHVADDVDRSRHAFAEQRLPRALVGTEQKLGHGVDRDPVVLLGHRQVAAAQPRFHVRDAGCPCRPRPACRRASCWCRRRRASSRAAPARAPLRSAAASSRRRRCADRAGSAARAARAPHRRHRRARDPSAGRCAVRPPRSRPRGARQRPDRT